MTAAAPTKPPALPGYELLQHLGAGGYGEVWSARVPGGLIKALKYIHGRHDESRAANELKSLERIREVRHPFVVSLERVEFVDNRLVVVTELADGSLRDLYRECVRRGQSGVPRDELLGYLRDAADALDYLTDKHGLQHLDVKPENILLLAGHAKIADFGLVKAINDQSQSLVGGMTPAYAAPEVFRGAPSRTSDQYSLAIVYQLLLTGALPFGGENTAELTLQHLHDDPNLAPLSENDRYVVSRALSKSPEHRYASCSEFVRALQGAAGFGAVAGTTRAESPDRTALVDAMTEVAEQTQYPESISRDLRLNLPALPAEGGRDLGAIDLPAIEFRASPTLFIGVGGTAGLVLRELRQQLSERFQLTAPIPSMPMLLLDTDPQSLSAATRGGDAGMGLRREETIALSLRRPQEYREKSPELLRWLSRRWLYNIPRSRLTEGIRPLGRLALVDNSRRTFQRIRGALCECVAPESLEASCELTGMPFRADALRVYLITSAAGGTGGGMAIDVAYAVRSLLERMALPRTRLIGIATCSTGRDAERAGLARVNAYSWLSELQHYRSPQAAYDGDAGSGLASHAVGVEPFDASYLVDLGDRLDDARFQQACRGVADYLFVDAGTPAQSALDACRAQPPDGGSRGSLRSFSVTRHESATSDSRRDAEQLVINLLLSSWLGAGAARLADDGGSGTEQIVMGAGELVARVQLDAARLATRCRALVETQLNALPSGTAHGASILSRLNATDALFAKRGDAGGSLLGGGAPVSVGGATVGELVAPLAVKLQDEVTAWALARLDIPGERLGGGVRAVEWLQKHTESLTARLQRFAAATRHKIKEAVRAASDPQADAEYVCGRYRQLCGDLAAIEGAAIVAAGVRCQLRETLESLGEARANISGLAELLRGHAIEPSAECHELLSQAGAPACKLALSLDGRLQEEWLAAAGGLRQALSSNQGRTELAAAIRRGAQQCVRETLNAKPAGASAPLGEATTPPELCRFGGAYRRLVVTPGGAPPDAGGWANATLVVGPTNDAYQVVECEGISAPHAAANLVGGRSDYAEFARRVHTRGDIQWSDVLAPPRDGDRDNPLLDFPSPTTRIALEACSPLQGAPASAPV